MTYCIGLKLDAGLVLLSDTRTNAGIDSVSRFRKTFRYEAPGRVVVLMTAGNLSITQGVISQIDADLQPGAEPEGPTVLTAPSLFSIAELAGGRMRNRLDRYGPGMEKDGVSSAASMIVGGQIEGEAPRMFLVYSAGNFIECEPDTPYFQIGETKYGKPIIERTISSATSLAEGVRTCLVSMDLTVRSNLSVGLPLDLTVVEAGAMRVTASRRIEERDETYVAISAGWADALRNALAGLPDVEGWLRDDNLVL